MTYLLKYYSQCKKCCDPFAKHKKPVKAGLVSISLLQANRWVLGCGKSIIPGHKIC